MMNLTKILSIIFLSTANGFIINRQQSQPQSFIHSQSNFPLRATLEEATPSLKEPPSFDPKNTQDLYNNVQNTYGRYPLTIASAKGCVLTDAHGKEYLDFVSGIATCALGHANQDMIDALTDQMSNMHHISNLYFIPQQAQLATWLTENSCAEKAFFCNSGAEANEAAIKLARKHASNRGITDPIILTAINSFHGRTLAALSATAQPKYHKGFTYGGEMVQGFHAVPYNDVGALEEAVTEWSKTPADLEAEGRKRGVAAILMEPLQGEGGIVPGDVAFFAKARELCDDTGALLMCDEVQVGMGRSGCLWGHEYIGVVPDVFTSAKALGGGVPIGAMMARGQAATVFGPRDHSSTYGGNPLACRAGLVVASYLTKNNLLENVKARGEQLSAGLESLAKEYPDVLGGVRGWGLLKGVEVKDGYAAGKVVGDAMKRGLLLVPAGSNVVRFVPPLIVSEAEVDEALAKFKEAVSGLTEAG